MFGTLTSLKEIKLDPRPVRQPFEIAVIYVVVVGVGAVFAAAAAAAAEAEAEAIIIIIFCWQSSVLAVFNSTIYL